jgi:anti-sigma B factor antagonist
MEYQIERRDDILVLKFSGDITVYQLQHFKQALEVVKKQKYQGKNIIIDLAEVDYFDALALGSLCAFSRQVREKGGDLKLINMNQDIKLVFDLSHLSKVYEIYDSMEKAVKSFLN